MHRKLLIISTILLANDPVLNAMKLPKLNKQKIVTIKRENGHIQIALNKTKWHETKIKFQEKKRFIFSKVNSDTIASTGNMALGAMSTYGVAKGFWDANSFLIFGSLGQGIVGCMNMRLINVHATAQLEDLKQIQKKLLTDEQLETLDKTALSNYKKNLLEKENQIDAGAFGGASFVNATMGIIYALISINASMELKWDPNLIQWVRFPAAISLWHGFNLMKTASKWNPHADTESRYKKVLESVDKRLEVIKKNEATADEAVKKKLQEAIG